MRGTPSPRPALTPADIHQLLPQLRGLVAGMPSLVTGPAADVCQHCHQPGRVEPADDATTDAEVLARWDQYVRDHHRPATVRLYAWCARDFLAYTAEETGQPGHLAGPEDLRRWLDRPTKPSSRARGDRLTDKSRSGYEAAICAFTRWASAEGLIPTDPMAAWQPVGHYDPPERYVSRAAIRHAIASAAEAGDARMVVMLHLVVGAGLRNHAIAKLRTEHVRLTSRVLTAARKGGGTYRVPINDDLAGVLTGWLAGPGLSRPVVSSAGNEPGRHLSPGWVCRLINDHLRDCGINETAHGLRHSAGKEVAAVAGIRAAQLFLGHRSIATTERVYLLGADADVWRGVFGRPPMAADFDVMGAPPDVLMPAPRPGPFQDRDLHGLGLRHAPHATPVLGEGHEPWRRHQPPPGDSEPAAQPG